MKVLFALTGWLLWNFAIFSLDKNKEDEAHRKFPIMQYVGEKWDNWLGSLICSAGLFLIMKLGYGVDVLSLTNINLKWSDAFIALGGPGFEIVLWAVGKIKSQFPRA
jgi:hypothetical protein